MLDHHCNYNLSPKIWEQTFLNQIYIFPLCSLLSVSKLPVSESCPYLPVSEKAQNENHSSERGRCIIHLWNRIYVVQIDSLIREK